MGELDDALTRTVLQELELLTAELRSCQSALAQANALVREYRERELRS